MENKKQKSVLTRKGYLLESVLVATLVTLMLTACKSDSQGVSFVFPAEPTPESSRRVVSSTLNWQELWRQQVLLSYGHLPLTVDGQGKIVLPINRGTEGVLVALNPYTGQRVWSQEFVSPYRGDAYAVDSVFADSDRIYIALPYVVKAFSAADGQPQWTTLDLPGHTRYTIVPSTRPGLIRLIGGAGYYVDKQNGTVSPVEKLSDESEIETDKLACQVDLDFRLACIDTETHQPAWQVNLGWPVEEVQSVNSKIIVASAGNSYRNLLAGIDQSTGQILWSQPKREVVSNFVVAGEKVYALAMNSALVQYDPVTGNEIGRMEFSGKEFDTDQGNQYWLLATGSEIIVYLGDSQELIAFSPK